MNIFYNLQQKLNIDIININQNASYNNNNISNCCLLNAIVIILKIFGSKFIKEDNMIDDGIILYYFLKKHNIKLYELGEM